MKKLSYLFILAALFSCKKEKQSNTNQQPMYVKIQVVDNDGLTKSSNIIVIK